MLNAKVTAVLLALVSFIVGQTGYVCLNVDAGSALLSPGFDALVPFGGYDEVYALGDTGLIAMRQKDDGLYLVADGSGSPLTRAAFEGAEVCEGKLLLKSGGLWGIYDRDLTPLTASVYTAVFPAGESCFCFKDTLWDDRPDRLYIADMYGNETATDRLLNYAPIVLSCGLAAVRDSASGRYGYIDEAGEWAIEPMLLWADSFNDDLAVGALEGGNGLINPQGEWMLSPLYNEMLLSDSYVVCRDEDTLYVYARTDEGLIMLTEADDAYAAPLGDCFALYTAEYVYLMDASGDELAVFTGDTLLYPGLGAQVIAADANGMYVYDAEIGRLSDFFDFIEPVQMAGAYICADMDVNGDWRFGAVSRDLVTLLEPEYSQMTAPAKDLLAAVDGDSVVLFLLSDDEVVKVKILALS